MLRKNLLRFAILIIATSIIGLSCKKESFTKVDIASLNPDEPLENTPLDAWLKTTFLDEYNVEVIYRYNRYNHEADRNVAPPKPEMVEPMMTTVLEGYILPYRKIAGTNFIKQNIPKQWVLFGSTSYDATGTGYAGTASGGVRINLFGINDFSLTPGFVTGRLHTIHHEFTHILNQLVPIPTDFPLITASTYNGAWQSTPADSAHTWGYVSNYASQNDMEDYAETNSALLVYGQPWFDNWVKTSGSDAGKKALRLKEQNIVGYYNTSLHVDFRALQKEVQLYIKDVLKDPSVTFPYWLNKGLYPLVSVNPDDPMYSSYGSSSAFNAAYDGFKAGMLAYSSNSKYNLDSLQFRFDGPGSLTVRAGFTATAGSAAGNSYSGDYSFNVTIDPNNGEVVFEKIAQKDGTTFSNGTLFITSFENTIQKFLTADTFIADWLPTTTPPEMYTKTGGFYQKNSPANYFYGNLGE